MSQTRNILITKQGTTPTPTHTVLDFCYFNNSAVLTDIVMYNTWSRLDISFSTTSSINNTNLMSVRTASPDVFSILIQPSSSRITTQFFSTSYIPSAAIDLSKRSDFSYDGTKYTLTNDGSTRTFTQTGGFQTMTVPFAIGGRATNGAIDSDTKFIGYFFELSIYDSGVLAHHIIPVEDFNKIVCLYDEVTNKYYYPESGTVLTKANTITSCYLNNAGIITDLLISSSLTKFRIKYSYTSTSAGYWCWGCRTTSNSSDRFTGQDSSVGVSVVVKSTTKTINATDKSTAMEIVYDGTTMTLTNEGITNSDTFNGFPDCPYELAIGRMNNGGTLTSSGMQGLFWLLEAEDSTGLIAQYLPAYDSVGVVCLYDTIGNKFYYASTGTITETA